MNKAMLVGRWTRDPEVRYSQGENAIAIARGSIAVDRRYHKDGEQSADFINVLAFGKTAEFIEKYFRKGMRIGIEGHIQTGSYTNKDNQKVYTTEVVIDQCEFVESKSSDSQDVPESAPDNNGFVNIPEDIEEELPFN